MHPFLRRLRAFSPFAGTSLHTLAKVRWTPNPNPDRRRANCVMLHTDRCGSTMLGNLLERHPSIFWDGDVFGRSRRRWLDRGGSDESWEADPAAVLRRRMRLAGRAIYGFGARPWEIEQTGLSLDGFVEILLGAGFDRFILLERRNTLRRVVSSRRAQVAGSHRRRSSRAKLRVDPDRVRFDGREASLLEHLREHDRRLNELRERLAGQALLELEYERDIRSDPRPGYARACRFLGVDTVDVGVFRARSRPRPLAGLIDDADEVRTAIQGTPYAWMLEED